MQWARMKNPDQNNHLTPYSPSASAPRTENPPAPVWPCKGGGPHENVAPRITTGPFRSSESKMSRRV